MNVPKRRLHKIIDMPEFTEKKYYSAYCLFILIGFSVHSVVYVLP